MAGSLSALLWRPPAKEDATDRLPPKRAGTPTKDNRLSFGQPCRRHVTRCCHGPSSGLRLEHKPEPKSNAHNKSDTHTKQEKRIPAAFLQLVKARFPFHTSSPPSNAAAWSAEHGRLAIWEIDSLFRPLTGQASRVFSSLRDYA